MTKITPILSNYNYFPLLEVIYLISTGVTNIFSYLYIIFVATDRKLIKPLQSIINKKKSVESELRSQKRELSMFSRIIAHDIKNNLTNIKGFSELFIDDQENYNIIKRQIAQIQELLDKSLKLADAGKIIDESKQVDLNKLIRDIMTDIVPNGVELIQQIIPIVYGDKQKLRQAFKNILENAILHGKPQTIEVSSEFEQKTLFIKICDDGAKISKKIIQNFSNEDYMVDLKKNHLGLKIIKRIINAHGWGIQIQNDPFTTYVISIPEGHYRIDTQIK
jgi:signal transduction histidine kinase